MKRLLLIASLFLFPLTVWSQATTTIPAEHPSLYRGVRQLGMGNAGIAMKGTDEAAPYYNPAAIKDYDKLRFRIVSPVIDFSPATIGLVTDLFDVANDINDAGDDISAQTDIFEAFVDDHVGEFHFIGLRLPIVTVMHKWFFVSTLVDSRTAFSFRNRTFTNMEILSRSDGGAAIGSGYSFFEEKLQVGGMVKVLHRLSINEVISTTDIITTSDFSDTFDINRGTGVGVDIGAKGQIPTWEIKALDYLKPTAGFTWQDIANTRFGDAGRTEQSISIGLAVHPSFQWRDRDWENHFALDIREINQSTSLAKKLELGYELMMPKFWIVRPSVRIGAHQLYIAGGMSLDFRFFKLEAVTYGEETGLATRQKESRRVAANLSFGF